VARPRRKVGLCRLVIVDHQGIAAGPPLALGDQRERDAAFGLQDGVDDIANPDERRSLVLPESFQIRSATAATCCGRSRKSKIPTVT
jgi:hypothetical protein